MSVLGAKVYVPGCGRGYDCVAFYKAGAKTVVGLEIADSAVCVVVHANGFWNVVCGQDEQQMMAS